MSENYLDFQINKEIPFTRFNNIEFTPLTSYFARSNQNVEYVSKYNKDNKSSYIEVRQFNGVGKPELPVIATLPIDYKKVVVKITSSFDLNNRYVHAYQVDKVNEVHLHFHDLPNKQDINKVITDARSPFIHCYDTLLNSNSYRDVYLFYIRHSDNQLCYRRQKEYYDKEHVVPKLKFTSKDEIYRIGMNRHHKLQLRVHRLKGYLIYEAMLDNRSLPLLSYNGKPIWLVIPS